MKLAPLGFWAAAAHAGAVFAMSAGAVSFGQIVKAAEPAFAVVVGYFVYSKTESKAKICMLVPIIVRHAGTADHAALPRRLRMRDAVRRVSVRRRVS